MLALTHDAADAIETILTAPGMPEGAGIRIAPAPATDGRGTLEVTIASSPDADDKVIEESGARVFVQESVVEYLDGKTLDAQVDDERVGFTLIEPS